MIVPKLVSGRYLRLSVQQHRLFETTKPAMEDSVTKVTCVWPNLFMEELLPNSLIESHMLRQHNGWQGRYSRTRTRIKTLAYYPSPQWTSVRHFCSDKQTQISSQLPDILCDSRADQNNHSNSPLFHVRG